jgi:3-hydroxymyristoyl/3-hydroxydecanoyl-(acyl carrier protein) dehydratase
LYENGIAVKFTDSITVDAPGGASYASLFVDPAADYLSDHFPGAPTLPGLVMLESAVRTAAALWDAAAPDAAAAGLQHVDRLQVVRRVVPGETLTIEARMEPDGGERTRWFTARGTVDGASAMRARFRLARWTR